MGLAALWGPDHEELGEVATASAAHAAIALTRGRFQKLYSYLDPNEDMAAIVAGPRSTLLVVADGHNGALAARTATEEVLANFGEDPPTEVHEDEWPEIFGRINDRVLGALQVPSPQPASRTVLLVAIVSRLTVSWASLGDAALVIAAPGEDRGRQLNRELTRFVGYPMSARVLDNLVQRGRNRVGAGEYVVLATDGLSEFLGPQRPADLIPRVLGRAMRGGGEPPSALDAATAIVDVACEAGAGDNVAVAVLAPERARRLQAG